MAQHLTSSFRFLSKGGGIASAMPRKPLDTAHGIAILPLYWLVPSALFILLVCTARRTCCHVPQPQRCEDVHNAVL